MRKLRAGVEVVDRQYKMIEIQQDDLNNRSALLAWLELPLGIICLLLSLAWIAQILCSFIIIPNGKPIYPLIGNLFSSFQQNNVAFLAFGFFSLFCLYLLWCTVKGNTKFGLRIFCCWALHPMK